MESRWGRSLLVVPLLVAPLLVAPLLVASLLAALLNFVCYLHRGITTPET